MQPVQKRAQQGEQHHAGAEQMENTEQDSLGGYKKQRGGGKQHAQQKDLHAAFEIVARKAAGNAGYNDEATGNECLQVMHKRRIEKGKTYLKNIGHVISAVVKHHQQDGEPPQLVEQNDTPVPMWGNS